MWFFSGFKTITQRPIYFPLIKFSNHSLINWGVTYKDYQHLCPLLGQLNNNEFFVFLYFIATTQRSSITNQNQICKE